MTATEIHALLLAQYDLSHALHTEAMRIANAHGPRFLDDPHYLMVSSVQQGVQTTITALQLLRIAEGSS